jgi:hypothetical protein
MPVFEALYHGKAFTVTVENGAASISTTSTGTLTPREPSTDDLAAVAAVAPQTGGTLRSLRPLRMRNTHKKKNPTKRITHKRI